AEIVFQLGQRGRRLQTKPRAAAIDLDVQRLAGASTDDALHVGERLDPFAVDRHDEIGRLEAGSLRRTAWLYRLDASGRGLLAVEGEHARKDHDREQEVRDRSGRDDRRALNDRLEE